MWSNQSHPNYYWIQTTKVFMMKLLTAAQAVTLLLKVEAVSDAGTVSKRPLHLQS